MRMSYFAMLTLILSACASRDLWPVERVDPETAVHVTIMAKPWLYVLDDAGQTGSARLFLNVAVVEANRTGIRSYWLNVVSWNTSARENSVAEPAIGRPVEVLLAWPTERLQLASAADGRSAAGISEPAIRVPGKRLGEAWFPLSAAQLAAFTAGAPSAISLVDTGGQAQAYAPWQIEHAAIAEFLKATGTGTK